MVLTLLRVPYRVTTIFDVKPHPLPPSLSIQVPLSPLPQISRHPGSPLPSDCPCVEPCVSECLSMCSVSGASKQKKPISLLGPNSDLPDLPDAHLHLGSKISDHMSHEHPTRRMHDQRCRPSFTSFIQVQRQVSKLSV